MSSTVLHIIDLVKSLPDEEQRTICAALTGHRAAVSRPQKRRHLQRMLDGSYINPDGIPNDAPIFNVLETIEEERHAMPGPPQPAFD